MPVNVAAVTDPSLALAILLALAAAAASLKAVLAGSRDGSTDIDISRIA